jgi:hypothetical protein
VRRFALSGARVATTVRSLLTEGHSSTLFVQTDIGTGAGVQKIAASGYSQPVARVVHDEPAAAQDASSTSVLKP